MRKFVMILALVAVAAMVNAQTTLLSVYNLDTDTVTNTGTVTLSGRVTGNGTLAVQVSVLEISGTTAGTLTLMGSIDNVTYTAIDTTTFSPSDVTTPQSFVWMKADSYFPYYRVSYTGSGTMAATVKAKAIVRRRQ